ILLLITVFGIVNIMLISVWERKKEIGTLRAIGYSKFDIAGIFLAEAAGIGFIGGLIGILAGGIVAYIMQRYGIPLPSEALEGIDFPIQTRIYGILSGMVLVKSLVLAIVATTGGAIIPALRASGMKIIDAIREY
ncbi:ABC transporter permease, partial [bacterium]